MPASTIDGVLDFSIRESSREAYVSPTRGAQGNALKTLVAMPFVMDGDNGVTTIEACSTRHIITLSVDRIRQVPVISHQTKEIESKKGTFIHVGLKNSPWLKTPTAKSRFLQVATDYTRLNPHLDRGKSSLVIEPASPHTSRELVDSLCREGRRSDDGRRHA